MIPQTCINPENLREGDIIGIVAPAGNFAERKFYKGIRIIESLGFKTFIPAEIFQKKRCFAGDDKLRADIINKLFANPDIKAVICARGGYGSMRILDMLDFDIIKANPKIFIGFSDISAILNSILTRCGFTVFHGPIITTLPCTHKQDIRHLKLSLSSQNPQKFKLNHPVVLKKGKCTAPLIGGNLTTLCHLTGTKYQPDFRGHILFLEDTGEPAYKIDRMLCQMKLAGLFGEISGIILGTFQKCGKIEEIYRIVTEIFADSNIPILAGLEAGHGKRNPALKFGAEGVLDADKGSLIIK